jgi:hypothetical protein
MFGIADSGVVQIGIPPSRVADVARNDLPVQMRDHVPERFHVDVIWSGHRDTRLYRTASRHALFVPPNAVDLTKDGGDFSRAHVV